MANQRTRKANTGEVAMAIMNGEKLTLEQFIVAVKHQMITGVNPNDDIEIAQGYQSWLGQYYEGSRRQGYICGQHTSRKISDDIDEQGRKYTTYCAWGIHLDELEPDKLNAHNIEFLIEHFGKNTVDAALLAKKSA